MPGLFLPFTPKAKAIEMKAIGIKGSHGIGPYVQHKRLHRLTCLDAGYC